VESNDEPAAATKDEESTKDEEENEPIKASAG
jgi:hypothetical protein